MILKRNALLTVTLKIELVFAFCTNCSESQKCQHNINIHTLLARRSLVTRWIMLTWGRYCKTHFYVSENRLNDNACLGSLVSRIFGTSLHKI